VVNNDELNDLYCAPNIVRVIKSRRMRLGGGVHIAGMGERIGYTGFWWGNLRGRYHLEDPGIDGRRWISGIGIWGYGLDGAGSG
jgi:hypothetical protein